MQIGQNLMKNSAKFYLETHNRIKLAYCIGFLFLAVAFVMAIMLGSTFLTFAEIKEAFVYGFDYSPGSRIFAYVRLPRALASLICGAALALSGAVIQSVLANRLASPGIIGVNSGAGFAVTLCTAMGIYGGWTLSAFAFLGALGAALIVSITSGKWNFSRGTVILFGVALNSFFSALSDTIISFAPDVAVMSSGFKIGEFSSVTYSTLVPSFVLVLITLLLLLNLTNELDVITLGVENAKALGMNIFFVRMIFLILAALLAGCAVSLAGLLSFVGLIVPHMVKRISGTRSLHLVGLCAVFGGAFVCFCDTISRTVFSPYEIPVGIIMSFLGVPFFVLILIKGKGGHHNA